jgi:enoyl-CoA hydratase/carnithine racemase
MSVTCDRSETAAVVTLRWPERRNALGPDDVGEVTAALEQAIASDSAAVVLTGDGAFCAGGDLPGFAKLAETADPTYIRDIVYSRVQAMIRTLAACPVPTIAAVDGPAVGLGMDLALACDMRFVGPAGWMQQGWARVGLITGTGGAALLHRLNPGLGWRLVAEQPRLDGAACERYGLGEAADESGLASALARASALAQLDRDVVEAYVQLMRPLGQPSDDFFRLCAQLQSGFLGSERFRARARKLIG